MVETICEDSGIGSIIDFELPAGEYRVKSVGERASVEGQLKIEVSN